MKLYRLLPLALVLLTGCDTGKAARDAIATDYGWIVTAQTQQRASCMVAPAQPKCQLINQAIGLHNTAIDALNIYCSGVQTQIGLQSYQAGGPCAPDKSLEPRLRAAITNLDTIVKDIKQIVR